ncbi:MAG: ricin-type beta-trefoil lectin domain protein [Streptosporangiaceae bacterium]
MSVQVAQAGNFAAACAANGADAFICNLDTVVPSPGSISVSVAAGGDTENVNVSWTVTCSDSAGSQNEEGATVNASAPLTVQLAPLPADAADGQCNVNAGITLPAHPLTAKLDFTGELDYTPAGSASTPASSGSVVPVKGFGGKCVDDKGNSSANRAAIVIWSCSSSDQAENWKFSNGELVHNGKCLNDKGSGGSGTKVILYSCNGGSNEKWSELANGELKLSAHGGSLCLDDPRSSTKNGTQLIVYTCKDSANQKWSLP